MIEVPVRAQPAGKKGRGAVSHRSDSYKNEAAAARAQLVEARAKLNEAVAQLSNASAGARELRESLKAASGQVGSVSAKIGLARKRVEQNRELVATGAGSRFDLERAEADLKELQSQLDSARASEGAGGAEALRQVGGDQAQVAAAKAQMAAASAQIANAEAQLADANWKLSETTVYAPSRRLPDQPAVASRLDRRAVRRVFRHELRRERTVGHRALHPERAALHRAGQRGGDCAQDLSEPDHQVQGRLHRLGDRHGAVAVRRASDAARRPRC